MPTRRARLEFLAVLSLAFVSNSSMAQSTSVEVWIRAFIPDSAHSGPASNYITRIPGSMNASMVQLHYFDASLNIPNQCFMTDNRGFSTDDQLSSRVETRFTLSLSNGTGTVSAAPRTTPQVTKEVECATGANIAQAMGVVGMDAMGHPAVAGDTVQVIGQMQARNIMTVAQGIAPAIDYSIDVQWNTSTSTLILTSTAGSFPSFEVYARQPGADWTTVLQQAPSGTPWSLGGDSFGINSVQTTSTVQLPGASGSWSSVEAERRFTLQIHGKKGVWSERNSSGQILSKEVAVTEQKDGSFRLERPNDAEVLTFLGYQPSLRAEILARGAKPSFMIVRLSGKALKADWNGLVVVKDGNAHLQQLIQPGSRPAKGYSLERH